MHSIWTKTPDPELAAHIEYNVMMKGEHYYTVHTDSLYSAQEIAGYTTLKVAQSRIFKFRKIYYPAGE